MQPPQPLRLSTTTLNSPTDTPSPNPVLNLRYLTDMVVELTGVQRASIFVVDEVFRVRVAGPLVLRLAPVTLSCDQAVGVDAAR